MQIFNMNNKRKQMNINFYIKEHWKILAAFKIRKHKNMIKLL